MKKLSTLSQALRALWDIESGTGLATDEQIDSVALRFDLDRWTLQYKYVECAERITAENTED